MNHRQQILKWNNNEPVTLFATATSGLRPGNSKLLAVSYVKVGDNDEPLESGRIIRNASIEDLSQGQEFHRITEAMASSQGVDDRTFKEKVKEVLQGCCFSYNPKFQTAFLDAELKEDAPQVHDLLLMMKGAEMKLCLDEHVVKDLESTEKFFLSRLGKTPSLKTMCEGRGIAHETPIAMLPVDYNVYCLTFFWQRLAGVDFFVQGELSC